MTTQTIQDPFDTASNPPAFNTDLWGRVTLNAYYCALIKGQGKVHFQPGVHDDKERRTAVDIYIEPLPEMGITNPNVTERSMIAESQEWREIVLKSLRDLGYQNVREASGKWVRVHLEPTGRTYTNSQGETRTATTFKFVKIFAGEAECRDDYARENGNPSPAVPTQYEAGGAAVDETEKKAAQAFLKVIVKNAIAGKKPDEFRSAVGAAIAGFPMVSKFFTVDSPEVLELLQ